MQSLDQISKVFIAFSPILANEGSITFKGVLINLSDKFSDSPSTRFNEILVNVPQNIVELLENDLYSRKMGPLLIDRLNNESSALIKHNLILFLIDQRPHEWRMHVENYIASVSKELLLFNGCSSCIKLVRYVQLCTP